MRLRIVAFAVPIALLCGGCVGSSRTAADYQHKVHATAQAVKGQVALVRLVLQADRGKGTFENYASVSISEASDDAGSMENAFATVQPPNEAADALRSELLSLLSDTTDALDHARTLARRGQAGRIDASMLADLESKLGKFLDEHPVSPL